MKYLELTNLITQPIHILLCDLIYHRLIFNTFYTLPKSESAQHLAVIPVCQMGMINVSDTVIKLRCALHENREKFLINYLSSEEMAQITVSLALPPNDSRRRCVNLEPLYATSSSVT